MEVCGTIVTTRLSMFIRKYTPMNDIKQRKICYCLTQTVRATKIKVVSDLNYVAHIAIIQRTGLVHEKRIVRTDVIRIRIKIVNCSRSIPSPWRCNCFNFIRLLILSVMDSIHN